MIKSYKRILFIKCLDVEEILGTSWRFFLFFYLFVTDVYFSIIHLWSYCISAFQILFWQIHTQILNLLSYKPGLILDLISQAKKLNFDLEIDCIKTTICNCTSSIKFTANLSKVIPYIYPFTIEFNILVGKLFFSKKILLKLKKNIFS